LTHQPDEQREPEQRVRIPEPATPTLSAHTPLEAAEHRRAAVLRVLRIGFLVAFATVTILSILGLGPGVTEADVGRALRQWPLTLGIAGVLLAIVVSIEILTPNKRLSTLFAMFLGLLAAMLATLAIGYVVDLLVNLYDIQAPQLVFTTKVLIGIALAYICMSTVLQTQDDFRLVIPYVEFAKEIRGARPLLLDSSVLIDGRIAELARTGIIQSPLVIPRFVVGELQLMADSSDRLKRSRGRRGLDMISRLQAAPGLDVTVDETPIPGKAVDQQLVELAKRSSSAVVTTDSGLDRVARIQGVQALNLNDVADAVRPAVVPGETLRLEIIKPGEQPGQGVGYLADGTMVVVEDGQNAIGTRVELVVTSAIQTTAGRMIFGRIDDDDETPPTARKSEKTASDDGENPDHPPPTPQPEHPETARKTDTPPAKDQQPSGSRPPGPHPPRTPKARPARGRNPRR